MAHQLLAAATAAAASSPCISTPAAQISASPARRRPGGVALRCAPSGGAAPAGGDTKSKLKVGSPIVILEAPVMLKTAASVPSLRHNGGQVKAGDVGRILARKPKDVWAVRLAVGTYLLDGKFFRPLDAGEGDEESTDG
ncbi:unnamed protein product [Urochloa decumbens]|uniref:Chlororespiratory reduction 42 n=1 Tax=Urochloa decumbens TaxID=240449 RepID=A0ABC8XWK7_9POAL